MESTPRAYRLKASNACLSFSTFSGATPPFSPTEAKLAPIDFLVFKGMDAQSIEEVISVEVKSGSARLNHDEHSLKDAIENKRVRWQEYRVPARLTHAPAAGSPTN
ncbi:MAG: Holliday junction resolvase-like protein [Rhodomicrobium sp.]